MTLDLARVKENVAKMVDMGAPEEDIDAYIAEEGTSIEAVRDYQPSATQERSFLRDTVLPAAKAGAVSGLQTVMEIIDPTPMFGMERVGTPVVPDLTASKDAAGQIIETEREKYRGGGIASDIAGTLTEAATNPTNWLLGAGGKAKEGLEATAGAGGKILNSAIRGGTQGFATGVGEGESRAENTVVGALAGGGAQGVGEAAKTAGKGVKAVSSAVKAAGKVDDAAARELSSQGVEVSNATAGSDFVKNYIRNHLAPSTFGGGKVREGAIRVRGQLDAALDRIIAGTGREATDPASGGELVRSSIDTAKERFFNTADQLYGRFEQMVDATAKADARNVLALVGDLDNPLAKTASAQAVRGIASETDDLMRSVVNAVNEDSKSGALSVGLLLQLRKDVGAKIKDVPFSDARQGALKRLYGAISRDIEAVLDNRTTNIAWNRGNMPQKEGVLQAWREANRFYARGLAEARTLERKFGSSKSAEQVFNAVVGATKADTANLGRLFDGMTPAARDSLRATVLRRMSIPNGGADFTQGTPATFAQNWQKLSPAARKSLGVDVAEVDKFVRNYDRAAPLITSIPENGMRAGATTGDIAAAFATVGGLLNPVGFLMGGMKYGGDAILSRILTAPQVLRAVNKAAETGRPQVVRAAVQAIARNIPDKGVREQFQELADKAGETAPNPARKTVADTVRRR
jgi:hypothetical protein